MSGEKNRDNNIFESYSVTNDKGFVPQVEQFENGGTMATADKSMYYIVSKNSFAYNPARINVGSIGYYDKPEKVIVSSLYEVFKTINNINDRFLWHWFKSDAFQKMIEQYQEGGVRLYFYYDKLCICSIDIPEYEEQYMIGEMLDKLDNLITLHQRKYDKLVNVKKAMLEKMFPKDGADVPEIRFKGFTEAWEQCKLGELGTTFTGLSGKSKGDFGHGDARFITYINVFSNPIADLRMTESVEIDFKQNCVKQGDVFFTTSSETPEEVGMSCVMPENIDNMYLNSFCFGYRPIEKFDLSYLAYALRSTTFRKGMIFLAQGISRYNISKNKAMDLEISVPSLEEQSCIGRYFNHLDNLITLHQRKLLNLV